MIDTEQIKQNIDCRDLIERDLGKPKYCTHKYSTYKCPPHHEEKGYSFQDGYQNWFQHLVFYFVWMKIRLGMKLSRKLPSYHQQ